MGRRGNPSRREFTFRSVEGMAYRRATCVHCGTDTADNSARLNSHLESCERFQSRGNTGSLPGETSRRRSTLDAFCDSITPQHSTVVDESLGRLIYGLGLPFSLVESPFFEAFVRALRPAYHLPCRNKVSGDWLDKHYDRIREQVNTEIEKASSLTLVLDGWTNRRNEAVIGFSVATPKPVFLKALFPGAARYTAGFFFEETSAVIRELGAARVSAVVTDNAAAMKAMWRRIELSFPGMICFGCAAHSLNLLLLDIFKMETPKRLLKMCKSLCATFAYSPQSDAVLKSTREAHGIGSGLVEPVKTRWSSYVACLRSVLTNKLPLQQTIVTPGVAAHMDTNIREQLLTEATFDQIAEFISLLTPIAGLIAIAEEDNSCIATMIGSYFSFTERLRNSNLSCANDIERLLEARWPTLYHPVLALANLLNPSDQGRSFQGRLPNAETDIESVVEKLVPQLETRNIVLAQMMQYRARTGLFESRAMLSVADSSSVDPVTWWKSAGNGRELAQLAVRVLEMPLSSASIERVWSTFGFIQNSVRNRLGNEKAEKHTFIYKNLRFL